MARALSILFILLSLTVATREIPELYSLSDDPSNDGQVFAWQEQTPLFAICEKAKNRPAVIAVPGHRCTDTPHPIWNSFAPAKSGQDTLRLISLFRT